MRSKKALLNVIIGLALQAIVIIYGFVVPQIIIRQFGSSVNGLISSITQFLAYISLLESGFGPVVKSVLYKPIAKKDKNEILGILKTSESFFKKIALVFVVYIIGLCFVYPLIIDSSFDYIFTISMILIIGISTFSEYYFGMTYKLFLQADQKTYIISFIQILTYIISIIIIVIMAKFEASIHAIKLVSGLVFVLRPVLQNIYVKRKYNINLKNVNNNVNNAVDIKQKWDGLAQHIAFVIHENTDITILTIFSTLKEVSVYYVYFIVVKGIKNLITSFSAGIDASWGDMISKGEHENLNRKFGMYEVIYNTINTIIFTCSIILIVPFISVYTLKFHDANYIRPLFGALIVISEYVWAIRMPYSSITLAAGHFKETKIGAWVESLVNIILSIIFVKKYGMVGIVIGTTAAMTIRTIEFIYHTNKYILKRKHIDTIKKIMVLIGETVLLVIISRFIPMRENISYINWIINAFMVFIATSIVVLSINFLIYKDEFYLFFKSMGKLIKRR